MASYSTARVGRPCGVSSDLGETRWGTDGDGDVAGQREEQGARRRNTNKKHAGHDRHRAHVPITDRLIEGSGFLQHGEGRAAVWSERRSRSEGTGDGDDTGTQ